MKFKDMVCVLEKTNFGKIVKLKRKSDGKIINFKCDKASYDYIMEVMRYVSSMKSGTEILINGNGEIENERISVNSADKDFYLDIKGLDK